MANPYIGEIRLVSFNFAPAGWALCSGQILSISQNNALFQLVGTTYGGNGSTTFALPDFRGRVPTHQGQGSGLTNYVMGETGGTETVTLTVSQLPAHNHLVHADNNDAANTAGNPLGKYLAATHSNTAGANHIYSANQPPSTDVTMNPAMVGMTGGSQPATNLHPFLTVNFIIAVNGIFPSQN